jgi:hypothetical protein
MSNFTVTGSLSTSSIARRTDAIRRARTLAVRPGEGDVKVTDAEGTLVFVTNATALEGTLFGAWERIESKIKFEVKDIEGMVPAYVRVTAQAVVMRPLTKGAPWAVVSPKGVEFTKNTATARAITNVLVAQAHQSRIEARESAKAAKKAARAAAKGQVLAA